MCFLTVSILLAMSGFACSQPRVLQGIRGHPECPCIDPWNQGGGPPREFTFVEPVSGRACLRNGDHPTDCYPLDYGANKCYAWDVNLPPTCADDQRVPYTTTPNSCRMRWCWVDAANCAMDSHPSRSFHNHNLSYSYAACGDVDFFSTEALVNTLRGRTFKVGVPASSPPKVFNPGNLQQPTGWSVDFINHLAGKAGFTLQLAEISQESNDLFPLSTYTACARDVALGHLDLCYGGFWETAHRLSMTAFSPVYESDLFYLVVEANGDAGAGSAISKIFWPFSADLWLVIFLVVVVVGFAMWLFGEVGNMHPVTGIVVGVRMAAMKMLDHGGFESAKTRSGSTLLIGFGVICMLALASYTANLASFLLMANLNTGIKSIDDAISQQVKICTLQSSIGSLTALYPSASSLLVPFSDWAPMIGGMDTGKCGAMLMLPDKIDYMKAGHWGKGTNGHCNKVKVGEPVTAIPVAIPISRDLDHALGYLFSLERFAGKMEEFKARYPPPSTECASSKGGSSGPSALRPEDLAGGLLIIGIFFVISLGMHMYDSRFGSSKGCCAVSPSGAADGQPQGDDDAIRKAVADLEAAIQARGGKISLRASEPRLSLQSTFKDTAAKAFEFRKQLAIGFMCMSTVTCIIIILILIVRLAAI